MRKMARPTEEELGDDFSYIIRMADADVDGLKPLATALTSIKGIGHRTAHQICKLGGFDAEKPQVSSTKTTIKVGRNGRILRRKCSAMDAKQAERHRNRR